MVSGWTIQSWVKNCIYIQLCVGVSLQPGEERCKGRSSSVEKHNPRLRAFFTSVCHVGHLGMRSPLAAGLRPWGRRGGGGASDESFHIFQFCVDKKAKWGKHLNALTRNMQQLIISARQNGFVKTDDTKFDLISNFPCRLFRVKVENPPTLSFSHYYNTPGNRTS